MDIEELRKRLSAEQDNWPDKEMCSSFLREQITRSIQVFGWNTAPAVLVGLMVAVISCHPNPDFKSWVLEFIKDKLT